MYLLKFDAYRARLPEQMQPALAPLKDFLQRKHRQEQGKLVAILKSARYREIKEQWRRYLDAPLPKRPTAEDAGKPIVEVAHRRTWRMYRRVLKEGQAITDASPATDLHELRKSCKKLRYLMEFFQTLYPDKQIRRAIRELKQLQDNLGDFQDLDVQTHTLRHFSELMQKEDHASPGTLNAMDTLMQGLESDMQGVRADFHARFERFATEDNQARFRALFHPPEHDQHSS